jgi:hypothetical protein
METETQHLYDFTSREKYLLIVKADVNQIPHTIAEANTIFFFLSALLL